MKILIINFGSRDNLGCYALLEGTISLLRSIFPGCEIVVHTPWKSDYISDIPVREGVLIQVTGRSLFRANFKRAIIGLRASLFERARRKKVISCRNCPEGLQRAINDYRESQIVVHTGGDLLTEDYGMVSLLFWVYHLILAILMSKKLVLLGESLGPYKIRFNRMMMKWILKRCYLVCVRESISESYLLKLGISQAKVLRMPDPSFFRAFELEASGLEHESTVPSERNGVCIVPSSISWRFVPRISRLRDSRYDQYLEMLIEIVKLFSDKGIRVVLVPHVVGPAHTPDDRSLCNMICNRVNSENVRVLADLGSPKQVRKVLSEVEMLVAFRMHAALAGYATGTPTLTFGYSQKFKGVMQDLAPGSEWFIDLAGSNLDSDCRRRILNHVWSCWLSRDSQRAALEDRLVCLRHEFVPVVERMRKTIAGST